LINRYFRSSSDNAEQSNGNNKFYFHTSSLTNVNSIRKITLNMLQNRRDIGKDIIGTEINELNDSCAT